MSSKNRRRNNKTANKQTPGFTVSEPKKVATTPKQTTPTKAPVAAAGQSSKKEEVNPKLTLQQAFDRYKEVEDDEEFIGMNGYIKLAKDLDIDPEDPMMLTLSWQFESKTMGNFGKTEFMNGMKKIGWGDNDPYIFGKLKTKLTNVHAQTKKSPAQFRELYGFSYDICKENGQVKVIDKEMAAGMLKLVFPDSHPHVLKFGEFLKSTNSYRSLNKDQWMCFLDFSNEVSSDLSNYDEASSWPCLFDDYISYVRGVNENED